MSNVCKNACLNPKYEYKKHVKDISNSPYKKCSKCCVFIKYEGLFCPCCGVHLSNRAKNNKARQRRNKDHFTTL